MNNATQGRRLTTSSLMQHWDSGVPVVIPIAGQPALQLRIDKPRARVTLRAPLSDAIDLPINALAHIAVETVVEGDKTFLEIATTDTRLVVDGYSMLMAVADRVQLDGEQPLAALNETLEIWESILSTRTRMSIEAEVGLFGELLIVRALLKTGVAGPMAWRGGFREEHDFGFTDADAEVKTTSSERRRHWIHGLTQLVATGKTPLWMLSLQVTRGGGDQGETLPELVDGVSSLADDQSRARIEANLAHAGWNDEARDLFHERWRLRSKPGIFRVDDEFPRLTPDLLADAGVDILSLRQVAYEIDLTNLVASANPPSTIAKVAEHLGEEANG